MQMDSRDWQPLQDTIFRMKKHPNTTPGPFGDCVIVKGQTDDEGRLIGNPLEDELHILMERRGTAEDGPITLSVKAQGDRIAFAVVTA